MTERVHCINTSPSDLGRENRPEPVPPEPLGLMRDVDLMRNVDAALVQQILDVPQ
jgi:hypothetical protein